MGEMSTEELLKILEGVDIDEFVKEDSDEIKEDKDYARVFFDASDVEACRLCLVTNVKMYSLRTTHLGRYMESITRFDKPDKIFPKYVCYECAACVIRFSRMEEKSIRVKATLQEIFEKNGKITKTLIEQVDRSKMNLMSTLNIYQQNNINYNEINNDLSVNTSDSTNATVNLHETNEGSTYFMDNTPEGSSVNTNLVVPENKRDDIPVVEGSPSKKNELEAVATYDYIDISDDSNTTAIPATNENKKEEASSDDDVQEIKVDIPIIEISSDDDVLVNPYDVKMDSGARGLTPQELNTEGIIETQQKSRKAKRKDRNKMRHMGQREEEMYLKKFFYIDAITVPIPSKRKYPLKNKYTCKKCSKTFYDIHHAKDHTLISENYRPLTDTAYPSWH